MEKAGLRRLTEPPATSRRQYHLPCTQAHHTGQNQEPLLLPSPWYFNRPPALKPVRRRASRSHRAVRRGPEPSPRLDVHHSSQRGIQAEKATGRAGLRNHQGATRGPKVPATGPGKRGGRVDRTGHSLQPENPLASVAVPHPQPLTSRF